jgi:ATP-binding cassette subfamily B (MDR/TAP) protein 6
MNNKDNAKGAKATDALLNYETVKYFTNEELEQNNFHNAITEYQARLSL